MTYETDAEMRAETPAAETEHFMQCDGCGRWFDRRQFDDVAFHCFGHVERADFNLKPGVKIN